MVYQRKATEGSTVAPAIVPPERSNKDRGMNLLEFWSRMRTLWAPIPMKCSAGSNLAGLSQGSEWYIVCHFKIGGSDNVLHIHVQMVAVLFVRLKLLILISVSDPWHFDTKPDPDPRILTDPGPDPASRWAKKNFTYCFLKLRLSFFKDKKS